MGIYRSEIVTLTPDEAQEWLEEYAFEGQRKVRDSHVAYLLNEINHDRLQVDQIVLCHLNGQSYLTDGQHRLHAAMKSGQQVTFNVLHRDCETLFDVQADYRRRDRGLNRTLGDCVKGASESNLPKLDSRQMTAFAATFDYLVNGFAPRAGGGSDARKAIMHSVDLRVQYMCDWGKEAKAYHDLVKHEATRKLLWRGAVMAVGLVILRYQENLAVEFIGNVSADDGLTKGMPEKTLLDFLRLTPASHHPRHVYTRYVASAWNAKYEGRDLRILRSLGSYDPIRIKGTPYNGEKVITLDYA